VTTTFPENIIFWPPFSDLILSEVISIGGELSFGWVLSFVGWENPNGGYRLNRLRIKATQNISL
jgi:hypothetical protein